MENLKRLKIKLYIKKKDKEETILSKKSVNNIIKEINNEEKIKTYIKYKSDKYINPKECGHNQCLLTINKCCLCSDLRPYTNRYTQYKDGIGLINNATRERYYCDNCKPPPY